MDTSDLLRTIPMFDGLEPDDLEALARGVVERKFLGGELIIRQGDPAAEMFIVAQGQVNIFLPGEASRRVSLKDIARGEFFGELALFDDKPRSASAFATTDAILLELSRDVLSQWLSQRPRACLAILRTMAGRLRETYSSLSEHAAKNTLAEIEKNLTWGQRLADKVAELNGSWAFILGLLGITALWMLVNAPLLHAPFDPFPYVFFNLVLAILVSLQGPLIVMSQNRQSTKDRAQAATDFQVNLKNEVNIQTILRELSELRAEANERLGRLEARPGDKAP